MLSLFFLLPSYLTLGGGKEDMLVYTHDLLLLQCHRETECIHQNLCHLISLVLDTHNLCFRPNRGILLLLYKAILHKGQLVVVAFLLLSYLFQ